MLVALLLTLAVARELPCGPPIPDGAGYSAHRDLAIVGTTLTAVGSLHPFGTFVGAYYDAYLPLAAGQLALSGASTAMMWHGGYRLTRAAEVRSGQALGRGLLTASVVVGSLGLAFQTAALVPEARGWEPMTASFASIPFLLASAGLAAGQIGRVHRRLRCHERERRDPPPAFTVRPTLDLVQRRVGVIVRFR